MPILANYFHMLFVGMIGLWIYYEIRAFKNDEPSGFLSFTRAVALLMFIVVLMAAWPALFIPPSRWNAMQVRSIVGLGCLAISALPFAIPLGQAVFSWLFLRRERPPRIPQGPLPTGRRETTRSAKPWIRGSIFTRKR